MLATTGVAAGIVVRRRRTVLDAEDSRTFPHLLLSVVAMSVAFAGGCAAVSAWRGTNVIPESTAGRCVDHL